MTQLKYSLSQPRKIDSKSIINYRGIFIAISIIGIWAISLFLLMSLKFDQLNFLELGSAVVWQTFLYTGLFITAHDAMHGAVSPQHTKFNHFIGSLCLLLYGFLSYKILLKKHWMHHHNPASELDPDFHDGKHKNFLAWYFNFMKNYWSWRQIITWTVVYNVVNYIIHIPQSNFIYFCALPSILSSLQLFYFGTFLTHSEPKCGYVKPHFAQSTSLPIWLSFITCYHFGYHQEHHEYPHLAWWQLPKAYRLRNSLSTGDC